MTHENALARAQKAVEASAATSALCPWRPVYHFAAPSGWINDPNGLIHYKGEYHLFYQHHPYTPTWGPMHWGHAVSSDLLHWRHLPIALAPTEPYELSPGGGGCFSGSAIEHGGQLALMYTGDSAAHHPKETQNIALSQDGIHFTKHASNPVIPAFPAEGSADFRDPKVWRHGDHYYVVIGTCRDGVGKVVLYRSRDLMAWNYVGVVAQSDGTQGSMWECPDIFELDGKHVLIYSPMGLGRPLSMYAVGHLDYGTGRFEAESRGLIDHGSDFYAPQTMIDPDGRRIMIAWMQAWGAAIPTEDSGWSGAMTLPRQLRVVDGKLWQSCVREVESLRTDLLVALQTIMSGARTILPIHSDAMRIDLKLRPAPGCTVAGLRVRCSADGQQFTEVRWQPATGALTLDRSRAGEGARDQRSAQYQSEHLDICVFVDRSSVEVFSTDGLIAITSRIYPSAESSGVELFCEGGNAAVECAVEVYASDE